VATSRRKNAVRLLVEGRGQREVGFVIEGMAARLLDVTHDVRGGEPRQGEPLDAALPA
jgi:hypothetical protein